MAQNEQQEPGLDEIIRDIRSKPTVPVWPHAGKAYGLRRNASYDAARRGEIETIRMGRVLRAITAPMRKRLGIDAA